MVSDMCQALERDHIFDELKDKKLMQVRKAKRGEILPTIYMEGKESSKFDPDFFIVNIPLKVIYYKNMLSFVNVVNE